MSNYDIWVDFNSINSEGMALTLRKLGPEDIWVGRVLIAGDADGNTCPAEVLSFTPVTVELKLFMGMFKPAP